MWRTVLGPESLLTSAGCGPERLAACCAAQRVPDDGDGIVLRGDFGPWYSPDTKECHLDRSHAKALLARVLDTYHETFGKQLAEVFLHYRVSITPEEYAGFLDACP